MNTTSLSGVWWGAPSLLLSVYRSVFRGAIEYGAQILTYIEIVLSSRYKGSNIGL